LECPPTFFLGSPFSNLKSSAHHRRNSLLLIIAAENIVVAMDCSMAHAKESGCFAAKGSSHSFIKAILSKLALK
jgi:hypothetical protein